MKSIKKKIIYKSSPLFLKNGFAGTSLGHILDKTGMVKGSLYHHFPLGKSGIAIESISWLLEAVWDPLLSELARAKKTDFPNVLFAFISNECINNDQMIFPSFLHVGMVHTEYKIKNEIHEFYIQLEQKLQIVFASKKLRSVNGEVDKFIKDVEILNIRYRLHKKREPFLDSLHILCKAIL